jgi:hypothetical protein
MTGKIAALASGDKKRHRRSRMSWRSITGGRGRPPVLTVTARLLRRSHRQQPRRDRLFQ